MATINAVGNGLSGATGTGNFVGSTSPTIVTPVIGEIKDANGNVMLNTSATASAVNYIEIVNAASGNGPIVEALGSDTNVVLTLNGQGNSGCSIQGTTSGGSAATGYVGEYKSTIVLIASAVSLTSSSASSIVSLSLTAGDWDVWGEAWFTSGGSTTVNNFLLGIGTTNNSITFIPSDSYSVANYYGPPVSLSANGAIVGPIGPVKISLSSTTTVYLNANCSFAVSTLSGYGKLAARRRR